MVQELRPRGIGEMLDVAVAIYRGSARRLVLVALVVEVPVQLLMTIVLLSAQPESFNVNIAGNATPTFESQSTQLAAAFVVLLVSVLSTAFVLAVCTRVVADAYVGLAEGGPGEAARGAAGRIFAVIGLALLTALSQIAGLLFCLVGAAVPLALFAVAMPVLILEGVGVFAALGRSVKLTKDHFFRVLGLVVTAQLLTAVLNIGLTLAVAAAMRNSGNTTAGVISQGIANTVVAVLTTPFIAAAIVACYFDLRIRNEAFDVQLLMQRNDARHAATRTAAAPAAAR
jgi:hypothetical protein